MTKFRNRTAGIFSAAALAATFVTTQEAFAIFGTLTVNATGGDGTFSSALTYYPDAACAGAASSGAAPSVTTSGGTGSNGPINGGGASGSADCADYTFTLPPGFSPTSLTCSYAGIPSTITYPTATTVRISSTGDLEGTLSCTLNASTGTPPTPGTPSADPIRETQAAIGRQLIFGGPTNRYFRNRFSGSGTVAVQAATRDLQFFRDTGAQGDWNAWVDGFYLDENFGNSDRDGQFASLSFGIDRYVSTNTLVGLMLILDKYDSSAASTGFDVDVDGWLFGPYFAHAFSDTLFLDGRLALGRGDYTLSPDGVSTGDFETDRVLAGLRLSGLSTRDDWLFDTYGELLYYRSSSDAYVDSTAATIASTAYEDGRFKLGTRAYYTARSDDVTPFLGLEAQAQFLGDQDGTVDTDFLARVSTGFDYFFEQGNGLLRLDVGYGGIGASNYSTTDGRLEFRLNF